MKFLIFGYYGFKNTGDELILSKIIEDLKNLYTDAEILVLSGDVEYTKKVHKVEALNRFSPYETEEAIKWCDVTIVGGGGLIHEYFELDVKNIFESFGYGVAAYSIVPLLSKIHEKPVFYWSHGIGPIFSEGAKRFCKWFYALSDYTTLRDEYSYALLKNIYPELENVALDTDPCIALDMSKIIDGGRFDFNDNRQKLGINIRPWFGGEKIIESVAFGLNKVIEKNDDLLIVPVPFDLNLDIDVLNKLVHLLPEKNVETKHLNELQTPFDVLSVVNEVDLFIGMRLHSILASRLLKKPTLALIYDKKVESAASNLGIIGIPVGNLENLNLYTAFEDLIKGKINNEKKELPSYNTPQIFHDFLEGTLKTVKNTKTPKLSVLNNEKLYENFIRSLKNEIQQIEKNLKQTQSELERVLGEKQELFNKLQKSYDDYKNLEIVKNEIENSLKQTQGELERVLGERNEFFNALDSIYSSDFWKVASFYYKLKEKSPVLRNTVKALSKVKRLVIKYRNKKSHDAHTQAPAQAHSYDNIGDPREDSKIKQEITVKPKENPEQIKEEKENKEFIEYYSNLNLPKEKNKFDVIFFSIIDWGFRFQRPQHIATRLAKAGHRVFYLKVSLGGESSKINKVKENIYEIKLPFNGETTIYNEDFKHGKDVVINSIDQIIKRYSIKEFVSFVEFPMWYEIVKDLKEKYKCSVVFDILDEFSGFDNVHKDITEYERKMMCLSDSIITSSKHLYRKTIDYLDQNNIDTKCNLVRNGAEFEHFSNLPENNLLEHIKKPIIGYYGAISDWFDVDLIEYAAKKHPEWSFALIGHTFGADIKKLEKMDNVYFLGEKPYNELPKYLYWFDVCLIPFKDVPLIRSTNPVKFYEYISSGKPVVATHMDELVRYKDVAYISKDKDEFVKNIERALNESDEDIVKMRKEVAKKNDWDERVRNILKAMHESFPKVSIIIVTYNNLDLTKQCLNSIFKKTAYPNYEVIVVDNNSSDGTKEYLSELEKKDERVKIILNEENLGFAKANNMGIKNSRDDYIILLNNDTIVTRGWIINLLKHLKKDIGMVGPVTNSIGNEAKINVYYENLNEMDAFAEYYTSKHFGESFEIKVLAMFCVATKRKIIEKVGMIDERYEIGMFEDDDYAMALKSKGYRLLCAEDVFIHHFGGATFKKYMSNKYREIFEKNRERFENKWGIKWQPHKYREGVI